MFNTAFIITLFLFILTSVYSILSLRSSNEKYIKRTSFLFYISVVSFIVLGTTWYYSFSSHGFIAIISSIWGYFYILSFMMILIVVYLFFSRWRRQWKSFITPVAPFIVIILLISIPFMDSTRMVTFDANSSWINAHVLPAHIFITIIGELFFFFSFAGSILYIIMEWQLRKKSSMKLIYRLPNLETIDNFNKWSISRSLILLSLGIFLGMIMAYVSFKSLFLGTAKEIHIYFSWIIILGIFIIRRLRRIAPGMISIINVFFFILLMFLFIFTNIYIIKGFHSFR